MKSKWESWTGLSEYTKEYHITKLRKKIFLDFLKKKPRNFKVLDVGCYLGDVTEKINKLGFTAYGIDVFDSNIKSAKKKYSHLTFKKVDLNSKIPFPNNFFDVIWAGDIIEHVYDTINLFSEFNRILKKGGYLVCSTPYHGRLKMIAVTFFDLKRHFHPEHPHVRFYTYHSLRMILKKYGFKINREYYLGRIPGLSNNMFFISRKEKELDWGKVPKTFR